MKNVTSYSGFTKNNGAVYEKTNPDKWTLKTHTTKKRLGMSAFYRTNKTMVQTMYPI